MQQRRKSITGLGALVLMTSGAHAVKLNAQVNAIDAECKDAVTLEQQQLLSDQHSGAVTEISAEIGALQTGIQTDFAATKSKLHGEMSKLRDSITAQYKLTKETIDEDMHNLEYTIDEIQAKAAADLKTAGCLGSSCKEVEPATPSETPAPEEEQETFVEPNVYEVETHSQTPVVYIISNEDAPDDYYIDPADENDYKVNVVVPEDPTQEVIVKLDEVDCEVKHIKNKDDIPSVIKQIDENGDETVIVVDVSDPNNPSVVEIQEDTTELVPVDALPEESDITDSWSPAFDEDGNVDGITDDQGVTKPLQPAENLDVKPVDEGSEKPSVPVNPDHVDVVDGGAKTPEVVIVDNGDGQDPEIIVDVGEDHDPETAVIVIEEQPGDKPKVTVDGEEADVVEIGGVDEEPEIEHTDAGTVIVDNTDPENPTASEVADVKHDPIVVPQDVKPTETEVVPTDEEKPAEDEINSSVTPVFDQNGHLTDVSLDGGETKHTLQPAESASIVPVAPGEAEPEVKIVEDQIYVVPEGGAKNPEAYIVHNIDDDSVSLIVDPADHSTPVITVEEVPGSLPRVIVDQEDAKVIDIGNSTDEPTVVHTEDEQTGKDETKVVTTDEETGEDVVSDVVSKPKSDDQIAEEEAELAEETEAGLEPSDEQVPANVDDHIAPTFDENGHVDGTTADDGQTKQELIVPEDNNIEVVTVPVQPGAKQPSVKPDEVRIIDTPSAAEQPEAWIVHNEDDDTNTLMVDPAKPVADVSKIEVIEVEDNLPRVIVDQVEAKIVVEIDDKSEIIHVQDPITGEEETQVITEDEQGNQQVNDIVEKEKEEPQAEPEQDQQQEDTTIIVEEDEDQTVPKTGDEDVTDILTPTYDQNGHINGTSQDDGVTTDNLKPAQNVSIVAVDASAVRPSVPSPNPQEVSIIETGADKPEAYIVHNSDDTTHLLVDLADNDVDSLITITEKPGEYPEVKVNDEPAPLIDIGGSANHADIVHKEDPESGEGSMSVVDNQDPSNPKVYDVDLVDIPDESSVDVIVTPSENDVPAAADTEKSWRPVFDATTKDVIQVKKSGDTVPTPLTPITPTKVTADKDVVDSFDDLTPEELHLVDGGAKEPTVYVVEQGQSSPNKYIIDPSGIQEPKVVVVQQPGEEPIILVDGSEVPIVPIGGPTQEPTVVHTKDGQDLLVDNSDATNPVVSIIEVDRTSDEQPTADEEETTKKVVDGVEITVPKSDDDETTTIITPGVDEDGKICIKDENGLCKETKDVVDVDVEQPAQEPAQEEQPAQEDQEQPTAEELICEEKLTEAKEVIQSQEERIRLLEEQIAQLEAECPTLE